MTMPGSDPNVPQGYGPAPTYSAGYGAPAARRPGTVTAAAVTGIVWGGLGAMIGLFGLLGASTLDDLGLEITPVDVVWMIVSLVAAVALLLGGLRVLRGGTPGLLLYAACAGVGLWVLAVIVDFAQGYGFSAWGLIGLVIPGAVVALLLLAPSKEFFALRDQVP